MARNPNRKHVRTGKKPGANLAGRPGPGRPRGSKNVLNNGEVSAIRASKWRVPAEAPPEMQALAGHSLGKIVEVMDGRIPFRRATQVLRAAVAARAEVCGNPITRTEHTGENGGAITVTINKLGAIEDTKAKIITVDVEPVTAPSLYGGDTEE